jgi:hypothetical protein
MMGPLLAEIRVNPEDTTATIETIKKKDMDSNKEKMDEGDKSPDEFSFLSSRIDVNRKRKGPE